MREDLFTAQARQDTNVAWAFHTEAAQSVTECDQAKWAYAVEQRAARLRAEVALNLLTISLEEFLSASHAQFDRLLSALQRVRQGYEEEQPGRLQ